MSFKKVNTFIELHFIFIENLHQMDLEHHEVLRR